MSWKTALKDEQSRVWCIYLPILSRPRNPPPKIFFPSGSFLFTHLQRNVKNSKVVLFFHNQKRITYLVFHKNQKNKTGFTKSVFELWGRFSLLIYKLCNNQLTNEKRKLRTHNSTKPTRLNGRLESVFILIQHSCSPAKGHTVITYLTFTVVIENKRPLYNLALAGLMSYHVKLRRSFWKHLARKTGSFSPDLPVSSYTR